MSNNTLLYTGAGLLCLGAGAFVYQTVLDDNRQDRRDALASIGRSEKVIFTSREDCVAKGFERNACDCAFDAAADRSEQMGATISYGSEDECRAQHAKYHRTGAWVGKVYVKHYHPDIVAIEAGKNDICNAVPLYSGRDSTLAMRGDGKIFSLDSLR